MTSNVDFTDGKHYITGFSIMFSSPMVSQQHNQNRMLFLQFGDFYYYVNIAWITYLTCRERVHNVSQFVFYLSSIDTGMRYCKFNDSSEQQNDWWELDSNPHLLVYKDIYHAYHCATKPFYNAHCGIILWNCALLCTLSQCICLTSVHNIFTFL